MPEANAPKILSFRIKEEKLGMCVLCEFGDKEIVKEIPKDAPLIRLSAIFDSSGRLSDVEVVCSKE